ncbi:uncharacterized protein [Temnothorax nylanderi]|uniref:uncharacterized protein n=1 Tax=Temnothorax nylanderi TaxID=102681 RepID=UPI003A8702D6
MVVLALVCISKNLVMMMMKLGLIVDKPKSGFGNTNDGNTARRFFENESISAAITGVDEDLIKRFHIILQAITSGHEINIPDFQEYIIQTAQKFVDLYPWFYMPTSIHKLLIHGSEIIQSALLPIGQMSEDAQESCNKYIKRYCEDFARKCSRTKTMEDLFLRLLASSDPYISSLRKLPQKKLKSLYPETVKLLTSPSLYASSADSISSFSISSDSSGLDTDNSTDDEN